MVNSLSLRIQLPASMERVVPGFCFQVATIAVAYKVSAFLKRFNGRDVKAVSIVGHLGMHERRVFPIDRFFKVSTTHADVLVISKPDGSVGIFVDVLCYRVSLGWLCSASIDQVDGENKYASKYRFHFPPLVKVPCDSSTASFDLPAAAGYNVPNAVNPAGGIGVPVRKTADDRHSAVFFRPSHGKPVMGGLCRGSFGCAGSVFPVRQPCTVPFTLIGVGVVGLLTENGVTAMAHKARIPSSASAPDTNPELINAYQLNGIDNKLDDIYQFVRYVSKQVFRNAIKRELCVGLKVASLLDLPAKDVTVVMQWLERLRDDAIRNCVATSSLEQRFLNQWLLDSREAGHEFLCLKQENPAQPSQQQVAA